MSNRNRRRVDALLDANPGIGAVGIVEKIKAQRRQVGRYDHRRLQIPTVNEVRGRMSYLRRVRETN